MYKPQIVMNTYSVWGCCHFFVVACYIPTS